MPEVATTIGSGSATSASALSPVQSVTVVVPAPTVSRRPENVIQWLATAALLISESSEPASVVNDEIAVASLPPSVVEASARKYVVAPGATGTMTS